jgi:NAD(P)-dependent dehydrogenase (short-subunit alcohol dehydrogenase family)
MSEFANKRYVVTGAASGIGHAVAEKLLAAGAEVYSLDRNTPTAAVTRTSKSTWPIHKASAPPSSNSTASSTG